MRRHSPLTITSAIVFLGGAGVLANGAFGGRAAATTSHPQSVRSVHHGLRGAPAMRPATGSTSLLLADLVPTTPLPYLLATRPIQLEGAPRRLGLGDGNEGTGAQWRALRNCESGDHYRTDTGNGYYGAYQFAPTTWWALGYRGLPSDAPAAVQDRAARRLEHIAGWSPWPVCSEVVGL
jgi:hypothetical protein